MANLTSEDFINELKSQQSDTEYKKIRRYFKADDPENRVIGGYLYEFKEPRDILYKLAESDNPWERRTAIVSTGYFLRKGELDDTYQLAEILLQDDHEFVQKAIGTWVRHAGKQDEERLLEFLENHASEIQPTTLTTMMEKLDKKQKEYFRNK